jgi:DNA polymerase IV
MERAVIHINVADFAVAVERVVDPRLRGRPVIVAVPGAARAAVYDMSEEAYRCGVRKGMSADAAGRRCPDAVRIPPRPERYEQAMGSLLKAAAGFTPRVEAGEVDGHLFMDVTGCSRLFGPPMDIAWKLRKGADRDLGLRPIWSVAPNKLVAKVATRLVKPDGEYIVGAGEETAFLAPVPLALLPGLEPSDLERCRSYHLTRAGELARWDLGHLTTAFGRRGQLFHDTVRGIDPAPVRRAGEPPPIAEAAAELADDTNDRRTLAALLARLTETVGWDLRRRRLAARRVAVFIDHADGVRQVRQRALTPATADDRSLLDGAASAFALAGRRRVRIRRVRVVCDRLIFPPAQYALFSDDRSRGERRERLTRTVDRIRERFGPSAIRTGRTLAA